MEALRAELSLAKEQARVSNAAALKAAEELTAEQAAHRRSEEKMAKMAVELKNAAGRYELLKKEHEDKLADMNKALNATKEIRTELRGAREELQQAGKIMTGAPTCCGQSFSIRSMLPWMDTGVRQMRMWI